MAHFIQLPQLEQAINYWRNRYPSEDSLMRLCPEASALADIYGVCIVGGLQEFSVDLLNEFQFECLEAGIGQLLTDPQRLVA